MPIHTNTFENTYHSTHQYIPYQCIPTYMTIQTTMHTNAYHESCFYRKTLLDRNGDVKRHHNDHNSRGGEHSSCLQGKKQSCCSQSRLTRMARGSFQQQAACMDPPARARKWRSLDAISGELRRSCRSRLTSKYPDQGRGSQIHS